MKDIKKYVPTILSIIGSIGVVLTGISVAKATEKNSKDIKECRDESLIPLIYVKNYLPSAMIGAGTIVCIVSANCLNKQTQALLSSAYILADQHYREYSDQVKQIFGEEAHNRVEEAIAVSECNPPVITCESMMENTTLNSLEPETEHYFYDTFSRRYFKSTMSAVLQAEYHLNRNFALGGSPSVNDWYKLLGLNPVDLGDEFGWDDIYEDGVVWLDFDHPIISHPDTGEPVIRIEFVYWPKISYGVI